MNDSVECLGLMVEGIGFRVKGLGCSVEGLEVRGLGLGKPLEMAPTFEKVARRREGGMR